MKKTAEELATRLAHVAENNGMSGLQLDAFRLTLKDEIESYADQKAKEVAKDAFRAGMLHFSRNNEPNFETWFSEYKQ